MLRQPEEEPGAQVSCSAEAGWLLGTRASPCPGSSLSAPSPLGSSPGVEACAWRMVGRPSLSLVTIVSNPLAQARAQAWLYCSAERRAQLGQRALKQGPSLSPLVRVSESTHGPEAGTVASLTIQRSTAGSCAVGSAE